MKSYMDKAEEFLDKSERTEDPLTLAPLFAGQAQAAALIEIAYSLDALCGILIDAFHLNDPKPEDDACWCDEESALGSDHSVDCPRYTPF